MIDIHSHVVWGLDDGASSLEDSLDMLRIASEDGITDIVATPHSNAQYLFQPGLLQQRTEELARRSQGKPVIHAGCEVHVSSDNIGPCSTAPPPTPSTPAHRTRRKSALCSATAAIEK